MKRKMYTFSHDVELLKEIDHDGGRFTAEEHTYVLEKEFGETIFKTRENLLRKYSAGSFEPRLTFLIEFIKENKYSNILSLGAGPCVKEYFLKMVLPEDTKVVACDFDAFFIQKAQEFFSDESVGPGGGIIPVQFDFFSDSVHDFKRKLKLDFDLATFFASAYVMDDKEFISLFGGLKESGVKKIIDFHAGYIDWKQFIRYCLVPLTKNPLIRRVFHKPIRTYQGKFHGYSRSHSEIRNLYKKSGWNIDREFSLPGSKYVAVLS